MWEMCGQSNARGFSGCIIAQVKTLALGRTVTVCKTAGSGPAQVRVDHWWP